MLFELFVIALLQFAAPSDANTANKIGGSSGWDVDYTSKSTTSKIGGSSGWDVDYTGKTETNAIGGSSGWDVD